MHMLAPVSLFRHLLLILGRTDGAIVFNVRCRSDAGHGVHDELAPCHVPRLHRETALNNPTPIVHTEQTVKLAIGM
jgi:hypothetical protein